MCSGVKLALRCEDIKDKFLVSGIVFVFVFAVILNMAVILGIFPPKGLPFPFLSYGGSSIVSLCFGIGLMLSIEKRKKGNLVK